MSRKMTHDEQVAAIAKVNPDVEILGEITGNNVKVPCRCKICDHKWEATPNCIKNGHGCAKCAGVAKLSHEEQIIAIAKVNSNVEVLGRIINTKTKVLCRCKICGHEWKATPDRLKSGTGCPECAKIINASAHRLTNTEHVAAIKKVNPNIEILEEITNVHKKVLCHCKVCNHEWRAKPCNLKNGTGCPECKKIKIGDALRLTNSEHVAAINNVNPHIEILEEIKNNYKKVLCRCKVCGHEWSAMPNNLKRGRGCPRCAKYGFHSHDVGKLYIMVDDLNVPTMMKIGVSIDEGERSKKVLRSAHKAGVTIPALHVAKTWEGPTELMIRIEQMMHENYAEWNVRFPTKFDGYKEFFYYTPETAEAFDIIEETYHEIMNANQAA